MNERTLAAALPIFSLLFFCFACGKKNASISPNQRFTELTAEQTGVNFHNDLPYSDTFNCYVFRNFYNGGGVGIGDVNNDNLPDLFFCGNMTSNKIYLNKGNLKFEDITEKAGLATQNIWSTGVAMADVNGDGWLDIYVCKSGTPTGERRHNELFINKGTGADGIPRFEEQSKIYHLDNYGLSTHAAFFDFDRDGDLDCYLLNNSIRSVGGYDLRPGLRDLPDPQGGNKLLRNDGLSTGFVDVSAQAGIYTSAIGFGLGVTIGDADGDGWQDIFVSNDFFEKDYLYKNLGNGKFLEISELALPELSKGSMGADMADLDNDGLPEIFVTEMTPEDDARYKTKAAFDNWNTYQFALQAGYHRQFGRNVLQKNLGRGEFAELGRMAGTAFTDWSWGALLADFDNDGWRDIFVANGIGKDLLDQDYLNFYNNPETMRQFLSQNRGSGIKKLIDQMPSQPVPNYLFKNLGELKFENVAATWGLAKPSFSNGSAYGDLDNDGDLDLVVNNANAPASVFRNETNLESNFLKIKLLGETANTAALGAKVWLRAGEQLFFHEVAPMRGFESCVDPRPNFGLGGLKKADSLLVVFPSGKYFIVRDIAANQILEVSAQKSWTGELPEFGLPNFSKTAAAPIFSEPKKLPFEHRESDFSDFDREPLLFKMYSAEGPKLAVGDVDSDGRDDFYIGGASGQAGQIFLQKTENQFVATRNPDFEKDKICEDAAAIFFDADSDGDLDLYVGSGSNEFQPGDAGLQDRIYLNDGRGNFSKKTDALPAEKPVSTACARPADVDSDGDLDLFVGMRMMPGNYGQPVGGLILLNDGRANFTPAFQKYLKITEIGMVTDACWADLDSDGDPDLVTVGEWQPVRIWQNDGGNLTEIGNLKNSSGWWNCIETADLDGDGDPDFVLGNEGLNSRFKASVEKPIELWLGDFDKNGWNEPIFCQFNGEKSYPVALRNDIVRQMPSLKKQFLKFEEYKNKTMQDIFSTEQLGAALHFEATFLESAVLKNLGGGKFDLHPLPRAAQISPTYAIEIQDFTNDGRLDILLGGNHERCKPETGIHLASRGVLLENDGRGGFSEVKSNRSGLKIEGVVRDFSVLKIGKKRCLLVGRNDASLLLLDF